MSEDHIKTVVLDPPAGRAAAEDREPDDRHREETSDIEPSSERDVHTPGRSWLS